jgi:hypothetical protein
MFPVFYFHDVNENDKEEIANKIERMNLLSAILCTVALIMCLIFLRNKPKTPPSYTSIDLKLDIMDSLRCIFTSWKNAMDMISLCACNSNL